LKTFELPYETKAGFAYTHKVIVTHEDLTEATANTAQTINILAAPAGTVVQGAALKVVTRFEDASDNALNTTTFVLGDNGTTADDDRYIVSTEANKNAASPIDYRANANTAPYAFYEASKHVQLKVGSMAAKNLSDIDSGEAHIYLRVADVTDI
jgi:hypothetical protein